MCVYMGGIAVAKARNPEISAEIGFRVYRQNFQVYRPENTLCSAFTFGIRKINHSYHSWRAFFALYKYTVAHDIAI